MSRDLKIRGNEGWATKRSSTDRFYVNNRKSRIRSRAKEKKGRSEVEKRKKEGGSYIQSTSRALRPQLWVKVTGGYYG
jgi:hypothetical protein